MPTKSGLPWVRWANAHATNSELIDDLEAGFRSSVTAFVDALKAAGATVVVSATRRNEKRAYLFHWSWKISQGQSAPSEASKMAGVDIEWDHGDLATSKAAALEMVQGFGLAVPPQSIFPPSLTSNHIAGKAIDMTIAWVGVIKVKNQHGTDVSIRFLPDVNANSALHLVGESYGVLKLKSDAPHWSHNGR